MNTVYTKGNEMNTVYSKAIEVLGIDRQIDKAVEEMGELTRALMKWKHSDKRTISLANVFEELADVRIMIEQVEEFFCVDDFNIRVLQKCRTNGIIKLSKEIEKKCLQNENDNLSYD
jgi:hypothetical protein